MRLVRTTLSMEVEARCRVTMLRLEHQEERQKARIRKSYRAVADLQPAADRPGQVELMHKVQAVEVAAEVVDVDVALDHEVSRSNYALRLSDFGFLS